MTDALLLGYVLGKDRGWLLAHGEDVSLTPEQQTLYEQLLQRRASGEPFAYITGDAWFYGRRFIVNQHVLMPRPETEHLIDEALAHVRGYERATVLDVGTGSGAIACTIAGEVPNATVYATDISEAALEVAQKNADSLGVNVRFEPADLLPSDAMLKFDCVIANLPYIPTRDIPQAPDPVSFEPRVALDGGSDGLREYRRLLPMLPRRLNPGALVLLEAAPPTVAGLCEVTAIGFPGARIGVGADYSGLARVVRVRP